MSDTKVNLPMIKGGTTKGDLIVYDGSKFVRLGSGTINQALVSDPAEATGIKWGSVAGGGAKNYIIGGDAESGTVGFNLYKDAAAPRPVDATGGTSTLTFTTSNVAPLSGVNSFIITKPASNTQGEGVSLDILIDNSNKAKVDEISFDYQVNSGTFVAGTNTADSDMIIYLYDITNSKLIEPSDIKLRSNSTTLSDKYRATFQTSSDSVSYRLIFHCASVSALAYSLKVDNISISPSVYVSGTPITAWKDVVSPPNIIGSGGGIMTLGTGGGAVYTMAYRQVGENTEVEYKFRRGTTGFLDITGAVVLPLPPGVSFHSSITDSNTVGYGEVTVVATANPAARLIGKVYNSAIILDVSDSNLISAAGVMASNANYMTFKADFRTAGLGSTTRVSDGYDGRSVVLSALVASQAMTANVTNLTPSTIVKDSVGAWSGSTYTVKTAGDFTANLTGLSSARTTLVMYKNGSAGSYLTSTQDVASSVLSGGLLLPDLKVGDTLQIRSTASVTLSGVDFSIVKNQGSQTISASELCKSVITQSAGQSLPTATSVKLNGIVESDTHGMWSVTNSEWTQPRAGTGTISGCFQANFPSGTFSIISSIAKNGTTVKQKYLTVQNVSNNYPIEFDWSTNGVAGDKWSIYIYHQQGTTKTIIADATYNQVTFKLD